MGIGGPRSFRGEIGWTGHVTGGRQGPMGVDRRVEGADGVYMGGTLGDWGGTWGPWKGFWGLGGFGRIGGLSRGLGGMGALFPTPWDQGLFLDPDLPHPQTASLLLVNPHLSPHWDLLCHSQHW